MIIKKACQGIIRYLDRRIGTALCVCCLLGGLAASPVWAGLIVTDVTVTPKNTEPITSVVPVPKEDFAGIYISDSSGGLFTNEGNISLNEQRKSGSLFGIYSLHSPVVNTADITLTQSSSFADAINKMGATVGMFSFKDIVNSGKVACTVDMGNRSSTIGSAENYHSFVSALFSLNRIENNGDIIIDYNGGVVTSSVGDASTELNELYGAVGSDGIVSKGNEIRINLDAGEAYASEGLASVSLATCYGLYSTNGAVENYSKIVMNTSGGVAEGKTATVSDYTVVGIRADGDVENHAPIDITAIAGRAVASGVPTDSNVTVYGILMSKSGTLASTAPISVIAKSFSGDQLNTAKQAYLYGATTITDYAIKFDGSAAEMNSVYSETIGLMEGASATFSSATLHAYMGKNFQAGTYEIPMLVEGAASTPADQFVTVKDYIRDFSATLVSGGGTELQKIIFTYEPKVSTPLLTAREAYNVESTIADNINSLLFTSVETSKTAGIDGDSSTMVASAGSSVIPYITKTSDKKNSVFALPVMVHSNDSSTYGYDSDTAGLMFGYTRHLNEDLYLGTHAGYTYSSVDYSGTGANDRSTDVNTYFIGLHGLYRYAPNWIFSGTSSFYLGDNDYRDDAVTQKENADYMSYAIRTELRGGYLFSLGKHNIFPEVGLTHSWQHSDAYTTSSDVTYETTYGTMDDHELYLSGKLKWFREFEIGNDWSVIPLVGIGVTQALLDGEFSNSMRVGSSSQLVVDEADKTTITPEFNLTLTQNDLSFILGYNGGYSNDNQSSMFWFKASLDF